MAIHPTLEPGPYGKESIPAREPERDFTPDERAAIDRMGRDNGCHTCGAKDPGTRSGHVIPDHQPVSALNKTGEPQRLYPQSLSCSREEGLAAGRIIQQERRQAAQYDFSTKAERQQTLGQSADSR